MGATSGVGVWGRAGCGPVCFPVALTHTWMERGLIDGWSLCLFMLASWPVSDFRDFFSESCV